MNEHDPVSRRFPLGSSHLGLPDRRLSTGRRRRAQHLAPLRPHARQHRQRRDRRRRLRPLPPLQERRRADAELGLNAYRFSIAWGRVLPEGTGRVNQTGLDFYSRLVDELLQNGITPKVTLYHWDLPAALDDRGGWLNPRHRRVVRRLRRRRCTARSTTACRMWATLNEPWVVTDGGYLHGVLAPGHRNLFEAPIASHNLLRAHGTAVQAYRADGKRPDRHGGEPRAEVSGVSRSAEDLAATRRADAYMNRQYLDPVFLGHYPGGDGGDIRRGLARMADDDLTLIRQPIDFLGINYYTRSVTRYDRERAAAARRAVRSRSTLHRDRVGGFPQALTDDLLWVKERYGNLAASTSPRTARRSTTRRSPSTVRSRIRCASSTTASTCGRRTTPSSRASTCAATSPGRCSTTTSGRSATPSASASSTSTTRRRSARSSRARGSTPSHSLPMALRSAP